jgi:hypothetical protein
MIDRKITLALILAVAVEGAGLFAWAGATSERLKELETRAAAMSDASARLARVEVQIELATAQLARIEKKLDRL